MEREGITRRLAAILSADATEYSRWMCMFGIASSMVILF
jgi:hypothetical protein